MTATVPGRHDDRAAGHAGDRRDRGRRPAAGLRGRPQALTVPPAAARLGARVRRQSWPTSRPPRPTTAASRSARSAPPPASGAALLLGFDTAGRVPRDRAHAVRLGAVDTGSRTAVSCGLGATPVVRVGDGALVGLDRLRLDADHAAQGRDAGVHPHRLDRAAHAGQPGAATTIAPEPGPRFWIRAELVTSQYERPPVIAAIRTNTMTAHPDGDGRATRCSAAATAGRNQSFRLTNVPVLADSLRLEVDQGSGREVWTEVDDFLAQARRGDQVYVLNRTTGEVRFGDGRNGAIPIANVGQPRRQRRRARLPLRRRHERATSPAGCPARRSATRCAGIDENGVVNLVATFGGRDEETLDEAKQRAPAAIRARCRAVTADDFEFFATQAANIARAKALPLRHPDFPDVAVPGRGDRDRGARLRRPRAAAERGHAAHRLRLPRPAPAADDRGSTSRRRRTSRSRSRPRWSPTTPPTWPPCSAASSRACSPTSTR